ncbi:unnamed protein product [Amoebophrya sp. A120]|nr:unnamed protein product [Amoebophrya sp. A120]|eukprot:GSA120T00012036001.1
MMRGHTSRPRQTGALFQETRPRPHQLFPRDKDDREPVDERDEDESD